jgi:hypothetical protein
MANLEAVPFIKMILVQTMMREREQSKSPFKHFVSTENCSQKKHTLPGIQWMPWAVVEKSS